VAVVKQSGSLWWVRDCGIVHGEREIVTASPSSIREGVLNLLSESGRSGRASRSRRATWCGITIPSPPGEQSLRSGGFSTSDPRTAPECRPPFSIYAGSAYLSRRYGKCSFYCAMALATCSATVLERRRPLPVDAMIPDSIFTSTHAITIDGPPDQVWPTTGACEQH
jgi:hypothetical protein